MAKISLYEYCLVADKQKILSQWNTEKNGGLTAEDVTKSSHKLVWWKCENGHEWQAPVYSRSVNESGCPYCANKRMLEKHTLAGDFPLVAAQWHPTLNGDLSPSEVTPHSHLTVWWRCDHGHEWEAEIKSRARGSGCPYCTNKKVKAGENDIATTHPTLASQWDYDLNGSFTPQMISAGATRKVWWKCEKGHEWQATVSSRSRGSGCPVCAGKKIVAGDNDLASNFPDIASQWHPTLNGTLKPVDVSPYSNRLVWWKCDLGHEYISAVGTRTQLQSGCPYCKGRKVLPGFNDLLTKEPELCEQWSPDLNGSLTPQMVTVSSHKKVWWKCSDGHVWKAVIASRTSSRRHGCPVCAGKVRRKYTQT